MTGSINKSAVGLFRMYWGNAPDLLYLETDVGTVVEGVVARQQPFCGLEASDVERVVGKLAVRTSTD